MPPRPICPHPISKKTSWFSATLGFFEGWRDGAEMILERAYALCRSTLLTRASAPCAYWS